MKNLLCVLIVSLASSAAVASSWSYSCADQSQLFFFDRTKAVVALDADDETLVYNNRSSDMALKNGTTLSFSRGLNLTQVKITSVGPETILEKDYSYACKNGAGDLTIKSQRSIDALVYIEDMEAIPVKFTCEINEFTHGECY